jgi:hypothetical protein
VRRNAIKARWGGSRDHCHRRHPCHRRNPPPCHRRGTEAAADRVRRRLRPCRSTRAGRLSGAPSRWLKRALRRPALEHCTFLPQGGSFAQSAAGGGRLAQEVGRLRWLNQRVRRAGGRVPAGVLLEWDSDRVLGHQPREHGSTHPATGVVRTKTRWIP